jgi:hypothetical protein
MYPQERTNPFTRISHPYYDSDLFITLLSRCNWPFSLKIRPLSLGDSQGRDTGTPGFSSGQHFTVTEAGIAVSSYHRDEKEIRQFLNRQRLKIIQELFRRNFNLLETRSEIPSGGYISIGIENPGNAIYASKSIETALDPKMMEDILAKLREF